MNKKWIVSGIIVCLTLVACPKNQEPVVGPIEGNIDSATVDYELAKNYFIKNTIENDSITGLKIENQTEFDSIFGMAALMGADGRPTEVDFEKQFVIAVLDTLTSLQTGMKPVHLQKEGEDLIFTYEISRGEKLSSSMHHYLMLVVDKAYDGNLKVVQQPN